MSLIEVCRKCVLLQDCKTVLLLMLIYLPFKNSIILVHQNFSNSYCHHDSQTARIQDLSRAEQRMFSQLQVILKFEKRNFYANTHIQMDFLFMYTLALRAWNKKTGDVWTAKVNIRQYKKLKSAHLLAFTWGKGGVGQMQGIWLCEGFLFKCFTPGTNMLVKFSYLFPLQTLAFRKTESRLAKGGTGPFASPHAT